MQSVEMQLILYGETVRKAVFRDLETHGTRFTTVLRSRHSPIFKSFGVIM